MTMAMMTTATLVMMVLHLFPYGHERPTVDRITILEQDGWQHAQTQREHSMRAEGLHPHTPRRTYMTIEAFGLIGHGDR